LRATTIPFISVPSTKASRIASCVGDSASAWWRCVDGLENGGQADRVDREPALREIPHRGEPRLGDPLLGEGAAHRDLVGHPMRDIRADGRQAERLGHRRDDRHGAVGGHRERAVHRMAPRDVDDGSDVREVHHFRDVGDRETRCVWIPVDCDDAEPALARLDDRAALMAARADEEHARHGAMLDERWVRIDTKSAQSVRHACVLSI